jgi:hypothetical protein
MIYNKNPDISSYGFHLILKYVLNNNYFYFKTKSSIKFYRQIKGIGMGISCGPSIANVFLGHFEKRYLHLLYLTPITRFIDDVIFIRKQGITKDHFKSIYPNIKLNIESNKEKHKKQNNVTFLDFNIS